MGFASRFLTLIAVTALLPATAAHAYLDPGSVGIAFQAIVGAIAAYILTGKHYIAKVKGFFARDRKSEANAGDAAE